MPPFIDVQRLTKRYGAQTIIEGLTLAIEPGEIVIFQGPSGIGKSTFLRCLTYLEPFQAGHVRVGGIDLTSAFDEHRDRARIIALRTQLGFVFQFFNLFPHLSVLANLMIGPVQVLGDAPAIAREACLALLDRVGLRSKADVFPPALSGGQQQRIGIARALAMRPKGILFDEPTSSLDPEMKAEVAGIIADLAREKLTMLIVTHEPAIVEQIATRVITLGPGCGVMADRQV